MFASRPHRVHAVPAQAEAERGSLCLRVVGDFVEASQGCDVKDDALVHAQIWMPYEPDHPALLLWPPDLMPNGARRALMTLKAAATSASVPGSKVHVDGRVEVPE